MTNPRWYFGWNIVAASAVLTGLTVGMRLGIGPFFLPIAQDLGFSRSLLASIVAIGMLCYGLAMPVAGQMVARFGTRNALLVGVAVVLAAAVLCVTATSPLGFGFAFGIVLSIGLGLTSQVTVTPIISRWFTRQRGMALFFLSTGSMAGMAIMTPVFTAAIGAFGWRATLLGFAVLLALMLVPIACFVMRDQAPEHTDLRPQDLAVRKPAAAAASAALEQTTVRDVLGNRNFWKIFLGLFACGYSMNLLGTHGVPMLQDHGFDAHSSAFGIGLIGFVAIFGTLILGRTADRLPRRNILAVIYAVRGLGFFALVAVGAHWELYLAASIGGLVWAGSIAMSSAILADLYGVRLVGVLYGLAFIGHQLGGMVSSWLGGWGYETFGTHWIAFGSAGTLLLLAAALSLQLPRSGYRLAAAR